MEKRHLNHITFVALRGVLLTSLAIILQWGGYLAKPEALLYSQRVIHCQAFRPPPDESLVHLDVDDNAVNYIGRWPWGRATLARIVDEIALTKPKAVEFDFLFPEPTKIAYGQNDGVGVDEDQLFATSLTKLGCAVVPVSVTFDDAGPESKTRKLILPVLVADPEHTESQCLDVLHANGISGGFETGSNDSYFQLRDEAFYERIQNEIASLKGTPPDRQRIRKKMLPHEDPLLTGTVLGRVFDGEFERVLRERAMLPFTLPVKKGLPPLLHPSQETVSVLPIGKAAFSSGFVDYLPSSVEGAVRSVPLMVQYRDRLVPQVDLATACKVLGADIQNVKLTDRSVIIPRPGKKDLVIPVSLLDSNIVGAVGTLMEVPLFGKKDNWLTMYDFPRYEKQTRHISAYKIWEICQTSDKLKINQATEDHQLRIALDLTDPDAAAAFATTPPTGEAKKQLAQKALGDIAGFIQNLSADAGTDPDTLRLLQSARTAQSDLRLVITQNARLEDQLIQMRKELREDLHDRAVFFGGTATGLLDLQPTSLFYQCPGIVIHGAIFNAIMTGKMWITAQASWGYCVTAVMGLLTLVLVVTLVPLNAFFASLMLAVGYLLFNGYYLFAYQNLVLATAGPLVAIALVWSGMTLFSFLTEIAERSRITKRFRNYVDPHLVNYMVEHPEHVRFNGEKREITTCFSDLAGFTTLTDQMGEKIVPLLSEYMGEMVPVIRKYSGYVSQMAGDGIYFFFGAPQDMPDHAQLALGAAFGMYDALTAFNVTLKDRGLAQLGMRIGISTGEVIVGDTGPSDASAYTAMGATVNLSSRLESANKVFGSRMLITARTVELLNGRYLVRPLANLQVAGKLNCVVVSEPLCLLSQATDRDHQLADCTSKIFHAYRLADFHGCIAAAHAMDEALGHSKFTKLYTRLATEHLNRTAAVEHCNGQIVLTEK